MGSIRTAIIAVLALGAMAASVPGPALADQPNDRQRAEEMAREAMENLLRALEMFMQSIPQYELPEVNEYGDIIIRRKRRTPDSVEPKAPDLDSTRT